MRVYADRKVLGLAEIAIKYRCVELFVVHRVDIPDVISPTELVKTSSPINTTATTLPKKKGTPKKKNGKAKKKKLTSKKKKLTPKKKIGTPKKKKFTPRNIETKAQCDEYSP